MPRAPARLSSASCSSASSVAVTPSGSVARCLPWPSGRLWMTGTPSGPSRSSSTSSIDFTRGKSFEPGCGQSQFVISPTTTPATPVEFAGLLELDEKAVDVPGLVVRVFEEENAPVGVELPRRAHGLHQQPEAPADERRCHFARRDRPDVGVVGVSAGPRPVVSPRRTASRRSQRERRRLGVADTVRGRSRRTSPARPSVVTRRGAP